MRILAVATLIASADAAAEPAVRLTVLGDSLAAGHGLALADAFPARLEAALRADGYAVEVLNAGVSGDTTAGGRARLDWTLADAPDAVIVELGANDGVRGIDPGRVFDNLDAIVGELKARGVAVLLAGMRAPPNYGRAYGEAFRAIYPRLADKHDVPLYPFFLEGIAARPEFNQPDGLHPNARGVEAIVKRIAPYVKRLLESAAARGS